mmetsp:Transcript_15845/g.43749  ORF Transcript_15845/g.43749 Transcript_15845/m.43749 type:complete len:689 (-) Transcript_15845:461-2527(-)
MSIANHHPIVRKHSILPHDYTRSHEQQRQQRHRSDTFGGAPSFRLPSSSAAVATAAAVAAAAAATPAPSASTSTSTSRRTMKLPDPLPNSRPTMGTTNGNGPECGNKPDFGRIFNSTEFGRFLSKELPKIDGLGPSNVFLSKDAPLPAFDSSSIFKSSNSFSNIFSSKDWEMKFPIESHPRGKPASDPVPPLKTFVQRTVSAVAKKAASATTAAASMVTSKPKTPSITSISSTMFPAAQPRLAATTTATTPRPNTNTNTRGASTTATTVADVNNAINNVLRGNLQSAPLARSALHSRSSSISTAASAASLSSSSTPPLMIDFQAPLANPVIGESDIATSRPFASSSQTFSSRDWMPSQTLGTHIDVPISYDMFEKQSDTSSLPSVAPQENVLDILPPASSSSTGANNMSGKTDWDGLFMSQLQLIPASPSSSSSSRESRQDPREVEPDPPDPTINNFLSDYSLPLPPFVSAFPYQMNLGEPGLSQPAPESAEPVDASNVNVNTSTTVSPTNTAQAASIAPRQPRTKKAPATVASAEESNSNKKKRKRRPRKKVLPEVKEYVEITNDDVLLGRGGRSNHHVGNKRYREEVKNLQKWYADTADKNEKTDLSQMLVDYVHSYGGRFLEKDANGWYIIPNIVARRKASQALREDDDPAKRAEKRARYLAKKKRMEEEAAAAAAAARARPTFP